MLRGELLQQLVYALLHVVDPDAFGRGQEAGHQSGSKQFHCESRGLIRERQTAQSRKGVVLLFRSTGRPGGPGTTGFRRVDAPPGLPHRSPPAETAATWVQRIARFRIRRYRNAPIRASTASISSWLVSTSNCAVYSTTSPGWMNTRLPSRR
jgi:hypothetical protein